MLKPATMYYIFCIIFICICSALGGIMTYLVFQGVNNAIPVLFFCGLSIAWYLTANLLKVKPEDFRWQDLGKILFP